MTDTNAPTSLLRPLVDDLLERRAAALLGGGEERIARQHAADKLTARERIDLLVDEGTFSELGLHGGIHFSVRGLEDKNAPADGVITGYGKVDGRLVAIAAYDFTVMAGSMGMTGEIKVARLRELALSQAHADGLAAGLAPARASRRPSGRSSPARATSSARRSSPAASSRRSPR